jgi:hypothetical protein
MAKGLETCTNKVNRDVLEAGIRATFSKGIKHRDSGVDTRQNVFKCT